MNDLALISLFVCIVLLFRSRVRFIYRDTYIAFFIDFHSAKLIDKEIKMESIRIRIVVFIYNFFLFFV